MNAPPTVDVNGVALDAETLANVAQALWLDGYVDTYLDRDVTDIAAIAKPLDLRRLMRHVCVSVGQVENQTAWGAGAGVPRILVSGEFL